MTTPKASRFLEHMLLWNFIIHLWAMATMALIVLPGLPGGSSPDDLTRIAYVADRPNLWLLGWLPWHLCAAIDLLTGIALVRTAWIPRLPALLTLIVTLLAVACEQTGELPWSIIGPYKAAAAVKNDQLPNYLAFERGAYQFTVVYGASLYIVMALGWTWCFAAAGTWNRWLTWLSPAAWLMLSVGSIGLLLPQAWRPNNDIVGLTNGVGFVLFEIWIWLVWREVVARRRGTGL